MKKPVKKVLVALPSVGRLTGLDIIETLRTNLKKRGYTPVFYLGMTSKHVEGNEPFQAAVRRMTDVKIAETPLDGYGAGVMAAINQGTEKEKPHFVLCLPDDYELEARHMHKMLDPLANKKATVTIGAWDKVSWRTFPVPQYLTEIHTSVLATYANPHFRPRRSNPHVGTAIIDALAQKKAFQTYTGMFAFTPKSWGNVHSTLKQLFQRHKNTILQPPIEPAILLAALKCGEKVAQPKIPRRFEHPIPRTAEEVARHRLTRGKQFREAAEVIVEFLENTGQKSKIPHALDYVQRVMPRIEKRDVLRKGQRPIERGRTMSAMPTK